jgi:hypothetical protein
MKAVGLPPQKALDAERSFQRGRDLFRAGDVMQALRQFEAAMLADPASEEYPLFAEWSRHHLAGTNLVGAIGAQLTTLAKHALEQNSKCAFGYCVVAEVLRAGGKDAEARSQLAHAIRLDRDLFDAIREKRVGSLRRNRTEADTPSSSGKLPPSSDGTRGRR